MKIRLILSVGLTISLFAIAFLCFPIRKPKAPKTNLIEGAWFTGNAAVFDGTRGLDVEDLRSNAIAGHTTIYRNGGVIHYIYGGSNDGPALQAAILNSNAYSQDGLHLYRVRTH